MNRPVVEPVLLGFGTEQARQRRVGEGQPHDEHDGGEKEPVETQDDRPEGVREHQQAGVGGLAAEQRPEDQVGDGVDDDQREDEQPRHVDQKRLVAARQDRDGGDPGQRDVDDLHADCGDQARDTRQRAGECRVGHFGGGRGDGVVPLEDGDGDEHGHDDVEEVAPEDGLVVEPEQPLADAPPVDQQVVGHDDHDEEVEEKARNQAGQEGGVVGREGHEDVEFAGPVGPDEPLTVSSGNSSMPPNHSRFSEATSMTGYWSISWRASTTSIASV